MLILLLVEKRENERMKKYLLEAIKCIQKNKILVIGDMIADVYLKGNISRISREAPVLVLQQEKESIVAGGAANVASNVASLGGGAIAMGVWGKDNRADELINCLVRNHVNVDRFVCDPTCPTISKTRIVAGGHATVSQQIVRIDNEWKNGIHPSSEKKIIEYLEELLPSIHGVVISDYGSGTITENIRKYIIDFCHKNNVPSIVDSRYSIGDFYNIGYVKQNDSELAMAMGRKKLVGNDIYKYGRKLQKDLNSQGVLITRGENGMVLFKNDGSFIDIPVSNKSEVYDVSGAGDTCVSMMILALAAGVDSAIAAELSNIAAGIAVRKYGTATVKKSELEEMLMVL